jgi:hypothetical protein
MSITIKIAGTDTTATIEGHVWTSAQPGLAEALNRLRRSHSPAEPHPELTEAERMLELFGGEVIHADPAPASVPGRLY